MKTFALVSTSMWLAVFISTRAAAQESTFDRASDKDALQKQIDQAKKVVSQFKQGRVIVGQVLVEQSQDPELVNSQMLILKDGFFAGPTRDLERPVGFRMHLYAPYDLDLKGKTGDVIDVGFIQMKRLLPRYLVPLTGKLELEGSEDLREASLSLTVANGPVNTPSNGTEPRRRWAEALAVPIAPSGLIAAKGFSPIKYYGRFTAPGYVSKLLSIEFKPEVGADLGTIKLEKPRRITIEYLVGPFDENSAKKAILAGGERWKVTPDIYGWDLEFTQENGKILFDYSYGPCSIADLGAAELEQHLQVDVNTAKSFPRKMEAQNGHVYLLNQQFWKRNVLFKIQIEQPSKN